jgi:uncharacterized protein YggE
MKIKVTSINMIKVLEISLLVSIFALLLWSKPWGGNSATETRTITVTGEAVIKAEPDEFVFNPYFELKGTDQEALKVQLAVQTDTVVSALKDLGVDEKDLKLDASSYDRWYWRDNEEGVLNAYLQINVVGSELVQKVQDYLLTTDAKGQLTPQATFSEAKKKELDSQAVEKAIEDAKSKAELQAKLLSAKLGNALEVNQQQESLFPVAYGGAEMDVSVSIESSPSLPVLSGETDYRQTVTVTYELR